MAYVEVSEIADFAIEFAALSEDGQDRIAWSASRMFDEMCEVYAGFFNPAPAAAVPPAASTATARTFYGNGTKYLRLEPYASGSIEDVEPQDSTAPDYREADGMLITTDGSTWRHNEAITVTARWGFDETPDDVKQAVIALAIHNWRTADPARATIDAAGETVKIRQIPQQASMVAQKYRQQYAKRFVFA